MKRPPWVWSARAERWRKPMIVALSVLGHAGLLAFLGLRTMGLGSPFPAPGPTIHIQLEPRPLLADETPRRPVPARQAEASPLTQSTTRPIEDGEAPAAFRPHETPAPPAADASSPVRPWTPAATDLGARIARGLRARGPGCAGWAGLTSAEQAACDTAFGERAAQAIPISGTGDAARDARFARQGGRRLARYEAMRAPLMPSDDPPCDKQGPIADCELEIKVELFSSTRGWLPNMRGDDD